MITIVQYKSRKFQIDLSKPMDISIPITGNTDNVNAWYLGHPKIEPVITEDWVGSVRQALQPILTIFSSIRMLTVLIPNAQAISPRIFTL